jgi:hypothetical protein
MTEHPRRRRLLRRLHRGAGLRLRGRLREPAAVARSAHRLPGLRHPELGALRAPRLRLLLLRDRHRDRGGRARGGPQARLRGHRRGPIQTTAGATAFNQWYRDVPGTNYTFNETLTLYRDEDTGVYSMDSNVDEPWYSRCGFFPLEDPRPTIPPTDADEGPLHPDHRQRGAHLRQRRRLGLGQRVAVAQLPVHERAPVLVRVPRRRAARLPRGRRTSGSSSTAGSRSISGASTRRWRGRYLPLDAGGDTNAEFALTRATSTRSWSSRRSAGAATRTTTSRSPTSSRREHLRPRLRRRLPHADEACDLGTDAAGVSRNTASTAGARRTAPWPPSAATGVKNGGEGCDDGTNSVPTTAAAPPARPAAS